MKDRLLLIKPLASGLVLALAFPGAALFPLAFIALVPYLDFLVDRPGWKKLLAGHTCFSLAYFVPILYWIPGVVVNYGGQNRAVSLLVGLLLVLVLGLLLAPFSLLTSWVAGRAFRMALLVAPGHWILCELLRTYIVFGGFPWAAVGYSQAPFTVFIQVADLGGVYFLSFLVVLANAAVTVLVRRRDVRFAGTVLGLLAVVILYGGVRLSLSFSSDAEKLRVGIAQGNIALAGDREYYATAYFETLPRLYDELVSAGAELVVLPEAQNPYVLGRDFYFSSFWLKRTQLTGVPVLLNSVRATEGPDGSRFYNSVHLLDADGKVAYHYDKQHLVPFGEYLPLKEWLTFAGPLVREVSSFSPGQDQEPGDLAGIRFGPLVCYEIIFPGLARSQVRQGAELLINVTNDGWFGETSAPYQHLAKAQLRAVETRRWVVRAANTGVSAFIDPMGRVRKQTAIFQEASLLQHVEARDGQTLFVRIGHLLSYTLIAGSFGLGLSTRRRSEFERSR